MTNAKKLYLISRIVATLRRDTDNMIVAKLWFCKNLELDTEAVYELFRYAEEQNIIITSAKAKDRAKPRSKYNSITKFEIVRDFNAKELALIELHTKTENARSLKDKQAVMRDYLNRLCRQDIYETIGITQQAFSKRLMKIEKARADYKSEQSQIEKQYKQLLSDHYQLKEQIKFLENDLWWERERTNPENVEKELAALRSENDKLKQRPS